MSLDEAYLFMDASSVEEYDEEDEHYDYNWEPDDYYESEDDILHWDPEDWYEDPEDWYEEPASPIFKNEETHSNHHGFGTSIFTFLLKYYIVKKVLKLVNINVKWVFFKWVFIVVNVVIEVCQATLAQENAIGKLSTPFYLKLSVITSSICLMISLVEAIHEGKESKVVWRKRGCFGWFYYPGARQEQRRLFARFALIFGVVSSMVQCCINLIALVINKSFVKFETLPLLLSSGYLVAALVDNGGKEMVKCEVHGRCVAECSRCKVDASV